MKRCFFSIILALVCTSFVFGQEEAKASRIPYKTDHFFFPVIGKTSGLGFSYANYIYFSQMRGTRKDTSLFKIAIRYTTENLNAFNLFTTYLTPSQGHFLLGTGYDRNYNWRYTRSGSTYYSTAYLSYDTDLRIAYLKKYTPTFWAGPFIGIQNKVMEEDAINATIKSQNIPGSFGGTQLGIGGNLLWSKRDTLFNTRSGYAVIITSRYFNERMGGNFNYLTEQIEYKHYKPIAHNAVVAWQANFTGIIDYQNTGIPFYALSRLGGRNSIRGLPNDFVQAPYTAFARLEYREYTVFRRLGLVLFSELGAYSDSWRDWPNLIPSLGGGLKYQTGESEAAHLALDWGICHLGWAVNLGFGDTF